MKILNLIRRTVPQSIQWQMQAYREVVEVEHSEVEFDALEDAPVPHSHLQHKLKGTWVMHEFWRKEKNKVQREMEGGV